MQLIIFKQDSGVVAVVHPIEAAVAAHGIHAIAQASVPPGKPYKIIDSAELPQDRSQRNQWTVDDADLTDGVGGEVQP